MIDRRRRRLLRAAAGAGAAAFWPAAGAAAGNGRGAHIVVAGGGFGGATCARYLRLLAPAARVTLVDRRARFVTGPFCNTAIAGLESVDYVTQDHVGLAAAGVTVVHAEIARLEPDRHAAVLADGRRLTGDRLVVAPGIDFRWDAIGGHGPEHVAAIPHAWPGDAAALRNLRGQLRSMPDDGTVIIGIPAYPYRCPPAPYERASLIAHYCERHKPKARILLLDAKDHFVDEGLFRSAWAELYGDRIEWRGRADGAAVWAVDPDTRTVETSDGSRYRGDVVNLIPPQRAAALARHAGLTDISDWAPVHPLDFQSTRHPGVHVLGDAAVAAPMAKSAYAAASQAKQCAAAIAASLADRPFHGLPMINACYSLLAPDYAVSVSQVFEANGDAIGVVGATAGSSPLAGDAALRRTEAAYARGWYRNMVADSFG